MLFDIENLYCGYNGKDKVLFIEDLKIPSNKIIFILGLSGIGKSTFIETLGVMNDTVLNKDSARIDFYNSSGEKFNIIGLWNENDDYQSDFRKKYLSFIFQNTNLMPNMTAGENVCINLLFKEVSIDDAKGQVLKIFSELNLPEEKFDNDITALSGGERQRIAFVRGILSDFEVLFGDEPTGNLDKKTSMDVLNSVKTTLSHLKKSSLIVTHDPQLALSFGDGLILITPISNSNGQMIGYISNRNMYLKEGEVWKDIDNNIIPDIEKIVYKALDI
jgi:ABC-type lipoprotein export system ATPase subunit